MRVDERNAEPIVSRRGFLGAAAAGGAGAVLSSFVPGRDAGAEELARIDKSSTAQTQTVVSPTANLTFKDFRPVTEKDIPEGSNDLTMMAKLAYYNGFISREALTPKTSAYNECQLATSSTNITSDRPIKLRSMLIALSNLIRDEVLTKSQARDFLMRHWHTASFIATSLDKGENGKRTINPEQAERYYDIVMSIKDVKHGFQVYKDTLETLGLEHKPLVVTRSLISD